MQTFPTTTTTFLLPSPAGQLEVLTTPCGAQPKKNAIAIICHPHPLHEGTMHNKVVTTLARTFQELEIATVRFNFRGVGKSTGSYGEKIGELADLFAVIEWVKSVCPHQEIILAGFSFGAYISAQAASRLAVAGLISVALPIHLFDTDELPHIECPWLLVQGDQDEVVSAEEVYKWLEKLKVKPDVLRFADAGHFFHGKLIELRERVKDFLDK